MKTPLACAAVALAFAALLTAPLKTNAGDARTNDHAALIDGNCAKGRPLGDLTNYHTQLRAKKNSLGYIRIRGNAQWEVEAADNVIGTIPCGAILWGEGPLKDGDVSSGIGYAVAVRDRDGHVCRGYVSLTVIEVVDPHPVLSGSK